MKYLKLLASLTAVFLGSFLLAQAATVFYSNQVGSTPQNGYYLKTDGTNSTWAAVSASVTASAPIFSSGGLTPNITWAGLATTSQPSSSNILTSNGGAGVYGTATSTLSATTPLTGSFTQVGSGGSLGCTTAASGVAGCLSNTAFDTFNGKQNALTAAWPQILTGATLTFGGLSTSSPIVSGQPLYATGVNTMASVASSTFLTSIGGISSVFADAPLGGNGASGSHLTCTGCLTANQSITLSGVVTGSGATAITTAFGSQTAGVLGNAATGNTAPMSTTTLYGALGTAGFVLTSQGGKAVWAATSTNALTVTTNAALTGVVTSTGSTNITSFGSQTAGILGAVAIANTSVLATSTIFGNTATFLTTGNVGIASTTPTYLFSVGTTGTDAYITSTGQIVGWDTTNNWKGRISPTRSFVLSTATTTAGVASTTGSAYSPYLVMPFAGTLRQVRCTTDASFLGVNTQIAGSNTAPSYFVASTTVGKVPFTGSNTFTAGQKILMNVGTTTSWGGSSISCTFDVTETP